MKCFVNSYHDTSQGRDVLDVSLSPGAQLWEADLSLFLAFLRIVSLVMRICMWLKDVCDELSTLIHPETWDTDLVVTEANVATVICKKAARKLKHYGLTLTHSEMLALFNAIVQYLRLAIKRKPSSLEILHGASCSNFFCVYII